MDKDVQLELVKALISLPTSALLAFFLITIYRDFRSLSVALLTFFNHEITAWLQLFREGYSRIYTKSEGIEADNVPKS